LIPCTYDQVGAPSPRPPAKPQFTAAPPAAVAHAVLQPMPGCSHRCSACFFARLNQEQLDLLSPYLHPRTYAAGQRLVRQGDEIDGIYFVVDGNLKATQVTLAGQQVLLHLLAPGDSFPAAGIVEGGEHPATLQAVRATRVTYVRRSDFLRLLSQRADLAVELIRALGSHMSRLDERLSDLSLLRLRDRVIALLLRLSQRSGNASGRGPNEIQLTHAEIASLVGGCRETVTRVLAEFRREGWVGLHQGGLAVLDPAALAEQLHQEAD